MSGSVPRHPAPAVLQLKHAGGFFAHYNPAEVERSDKTNAEATVDGVPLQNPQTANTFFVNDAEHAEIKIIRAFKAKVQGYGPRVLSIRINRIPCEPCARAILSLLDDYPQLAVRIKATTITKPGKDGLALLKVHPRVFLRYWTSDELSAKGLIFKHRVVADARGAAWDQFKSWATRLKMKLQPIETILSSDASPRAKAQKIKLLFKGLIANNKTTDRTVRNYTGGLIRALYPDYKDQDLAPYQGNWKTRNLTRAHIVAGLRPGISILDQAALLGLRSLIWGSNKKEFTVQESGVDFQGHSILWGGEYREVNTNAILRITDMEVDAMDPTIWFHLL